MIFAIGIMASLLVLTLLLRFLVFCKIGLETCSLSYGFQSSEKQSELPGVLLLHGFGVSPQLFESLIPILDQLNLVYLAPMITHTPDDMSQLYQTSYLDWQKIVSDSYEDLNARTNGVIVIGFSMGGLLSLDLLKNRRPMAVFLLAPFLGFHPLIHNFAKSLISTFSLAPFLAVPNWSMDCSDQDAVKHVYRVPMTPFQAVNQLFKLLEVTAVENNLKAYSSKVICWHSPKDGVASFFSCFNRLKRCSNVDFRKLKRSHHYVLQDVEGDQIRSELRLELKNVLQLSSNK